jgi:hypothetical protein
MFTAFYKMVYIRFTPLSPLPVSVFFHSSGGIVAIRNVPFAIYPVSLGLSPLGSQAQEMFVTY